MRITGHQAVEEAPSDPLKKFKYPSIGNRFSIGEFVYCHFRNSQGIRQEDFGTVTNYIEPDYYVVKLLTLNGYASVPIENIRKAGQA